MGERAIAIESCLDKKIIMHRIINFKTGLKALLVPYKNTSTVSVLVLVKVGSKYEKKEISGISHFLEHMLFKGTKKRPSPIEVVETLEKVGGVFNAFTGEEYTGYFAKVASEHLELAIDWVSDIYLNSLIPPKEVEKERGVIIEEINMYNDNPAADVQRLWKKVLYGDQPAGWDIAGTKTTVRRISQRDLLDYFKKNYLASNTLISLAGNFQEGKVRKILNKYFKNIREGTPLKKPAVKESQNRPAMIVKSKETEQTHLCLGFRAYNIFHRKRYAVSLLSEILGGMMSSRMFVEIREKRGLAYYVHSTYEANPDTGYLVTAAGVDNQKAKEAIEVILKEYKKIREQGVSDEELEKAKQHLKGRLALSLETSDALASFYGTQYILTGKIKETKEIFQKIDKIKKSDILKVARDLFIPTQLNLALAGPHSDKKIFQKLLNKF